MMGYRLNLGSGGVHLGGWIHVDKSFDDSTAAAIRKTQNARMLRFDLTSGPLPYKDDTCQMVVAHHSLDLLEEDTLERLLADIYRVLMPGCFFRVSLFDILKSTEAKEREDREWFLSRFCRPEWTLDEMHHYMVTLNGARKWVTTPEVFGSQLVAAGFDGFTQMEYHETTCPQESILDLDARPDESWFLDAWKASA